MAPDSTPPRLAAQLPPTPRRERHEISTRELVSRFDDLRGQGYRLALAAAHDDGDELRVVYLLVAGTPDRRVELVVRLDPEHPQIPTLAHSSFPAGRFEREMQDLFGIQVLDHPLPRRLVLHQHWPEGWYPMRQDAPPTPPMSDTGDPYPFLTVEGPGVYEIPVGPVHAGVIEPGHFRFSVLGETILNMKARLWFTHKGVERLFQSRTTLAGVELAERISGDTAVGHNLAYCLAVEEALGCQVPLAGQLLRAVLLELERLYNHTADIGGLCNDVAYSIIYAHALRVREQFLRLNERVTGHRLLRGAIVPGGTTVHILPTISELEGTVADATEISRLALENSTVVDRFTGTAVLDHQTAADLGTLGPVARASGIDVDARRDHPFAGLGQALRTQVRDEGDVMARFAIRVQEIDASLSLLRWLLEQLDQLRGAPTVARLDLPASARSGVGIVEGWRGTIVHRIELAADGTLTRVKVVDPSFFNWPALSPSLRDTIVPDFPLANKSFNLSYAGNDL
jgi:Ni,Fe-hydrogenase III large subunit/Ni,Fe-hydrogenase III component G